MFLGYRELVGNFLELRITREGSWCLSSNVPNRSFCNLVITRVQNNIIEKIRNITTIANTNPWGCILLESDYLIYVLKLQGKDVWKVWSLEWIEVACSTVTLQKNIANRTDSRILKCTQQNNKVYVMSMVMRRLNCVFINSDSLSRL